MMFTNPMLVDVKAAEDWKETTPFVATAPAVAEITRSKDPDVMPALGSVMLRAIPVVCAPPKMLIIVPVTVLAPATWNNPRVEAVVVKAPVPVKENAPLVAIAPAVEVVALIREPVVKPVVEVSCKTTPVVIAPAVRVARPVPV